MHLEQSGLTPEVQALLVKEAQEAREARPANPYMDTRSDSTFKADTKSKAPDYRKSNAKLSHRKAEG